MKIQWRHEIKKKPQRIVIKLGSLAVTAESGGLRLEKIKEIVKDIVGLRYAGIEVVIVSSGAINAGRKFLKIPTQKPWPVSYLQACSAVGQPQLMQTYQSEFQNFGLATAQVLVTHEDIQNPTRYLNLQSTLNTLIADEIIPIINENDSVSFNEITVGDNDQLAAMISEICHARLLCMLSGTDGLFDQDPTSANAKNFRRVLFDDRFEQIKFVSKSLAGRGGMPTKLLAVRKLTPLGVAVVLASFKFKNPVMRALREDVGTYFEPAKITLKSQKKARLLTRVKSGAIIRVDDGACNALLKNASVLPVGVLGASGHFRRGDVVSIKHKSRVFAYGVSEYDAKDIEKILGLKSSQIKETLGFAPSPVIIHRDNLLLKES